MFTRCRHLPACHLAVVEGGLTLAMELTTNQRRSSLSRFTTTSANLHVRHRLDRYGRGGAWTSKPTNTTVIASALAEEIRREVDDRPVETDGAARRPG